MTRRTDASDVDALYTLMDAVRSLMHRLRAAAEDLHGQGALSAGKRGVLMSLDTLGPCTVPRLARSRPVSRQHIQTMVNPLIKDGYVERVPNPAHKRSLLVRLTPRGRDLVAAMKEREGRAFGALALPATGEELIRAGRILDAVRGLLESPQWNAVVKKEKAR